MNKKRPRRRVITNRDPMSIQLVYGTQFPKKGTFAIKDRNEPNLTPKEMEDLLAELLKQEEHCDNCEYLEPDGGCSEGSEIPKAHWCSAWEKKEESKPKEAKRSMKDYLISVRWMPEENGAGYWYVWIAAFGRSACSATGETLKEAMATLESVFEAVVDSYLEQGKAHPEPENWEQIDAT